MFMLDDENYEKVVGMIENGERRAETSVVSNAKERKSESFVNKSTF